MKRKILWFLPATLVLLCLSACQTQAPERATEQAFKGMELYSWQADSGEWQYALLPGTNRIKTVEEIIADPLDQPTLEAALSKLAADETVFWVSRMTGGDTIITLANPPQDITDEIIRRATEADIHVIVVCP